MTALEFTGERYVPGMGGAQMAYEHLHRYLFAMRWARDRSVLDVASGAGYGAGLLAHAASVVFALELEGTSIVHARSVSAAPNLFFIQGDASAIPAAARSFGLVVALEILEHVAKQEELVGELARVVRSDGIVLISTPNRASYSDARNYSNPFHLHEFYRDDFLALLKRHFDFVELLHQHVRAGSGRAHPRFV